jgi:hypothetical protein
MTAPTPPTPEADPVAVLYARQRRETLSLWGEQHTATVPPWDELTPAEQDGWRKVWQREQKSRYGG